MRNRMKAYSTSELCMGRHSGCERIDMVNKTETSLIRALHEGGEWRGSTQE